MSTQSLPPKTVLLTDALAAIRNYRDSIKNTPNPHVYAFLIIHDDIRQALGMGTSPDMQYGRFRGYLGKQELDGVVEWHLYVVPVDATPNQNDVIPETADGVKYVYDFNCPCPTTCDLNSPLYLA